MAHSFTLSWLSVAASLGTNLTALLGLHCMTGLYVTQTSYELRLISRKKSYQYGGNTFDAVTKGIAELIKLGHPGPYLLLFNLTSLAIPARRWGTR